MGGRRVAFLPRHGADHELPPHRVPYRANVWAMTVLGVTPHLRPLRRRVAAGRRRTRATSWSCDQLVDRTWGRADTFFDGPGRQPRVASPTPTAPSCGRVALAACEAEGVTVHDGGTVVVDPGAPLLDPGRVAAGSAPQGWDVINMTQYPEAVLARELGLCYATIALVTDYDAGVEGDPAIAPVTHAEVFEVMAANVARLRKVLFRAIGAVPARAGRLRVRRGHQRHRTRPVASPFALPPPAPSPRRCERGPLPSPARAHRVAGPTPAPPPSPALVGGHPGARVATGLVADGLLRRATDAEARWGTTRTVLVATASALAPGDALAGRTVARRLPALAVPARRGRPGRRRRGGGRRDRRR